MAYDAGVLDRGGDRPLRIALFSGNYNYTADGANKALNRLVAHLQDHEQMKVRVYSPTSPTPAFPPQGELVSVPSLPLPLRSDYRMALGLPARLVRDVTDFAPDIVHLSAPDMLGFRAQALGRRLGVPVVASVHTLFETYLDYYGLGWLRPAVEAQLGGFYRGCDHVLAPTPALARQFDARGWSRGAQVWSRGVDHALFDPARRSLAWRRAQGFTDDQPVVAFFGRIVLEKGLAVFAETVERVSAVRPDVKVLVIGDGPARAWLEARAPGAVFTGFLKGPDLGRAVASADILLNPSCTETFCNVTLEAMASGVPVVGADAPNHRSLLPTESAGLLRPATDAAALAEAVLDLAADADRRRAMGEAARSLSGGYAWPEILSGVARVYRGALAVRSALPAAA
jgi:phosphatidylinositol alpha 1,6-mannosyltransferase